VIGSDERFWKLGNGQPPKLPGRGQIVLNEPLATEIGARVGDEVLLRIGSASQIPPDSALGRKTETIRNRRLKVTEIIPAVWGASICIPASSFLAMRLSPPELCKTP
jgi:hypothetical protein